MKCNVKCDYAYEVVYSTHVHMIKDRDNYEQEVLGANRDEDEIFVFGSYNAATEYLTQFLSKTTDYNYGNVAITIFSTEDNNIIEGTILAEYWNDISYGDFA